MNKANIVKETVVLTVADTGYTLQTGTNGKLSKKFGRCGKILNVQTRLDATLDKATAGILIITDREVTAIADTTPDEHRVYESASVVMAGGSATVAELHDHVADAGGAEYDLGTDLTNDQLKIAMKVTAAAGGGASSSISATVTAEVYQ